MTELDSIIGNLERQREAIDKALEALHEVGGAPHAGGRPAKKKRAAKKKGGLTEEGRRRLSENMRKRWAAKRSKGHARKGSKRK
jgi:hypothetical protein